MELITLNRFYFSDGSVHDNGDVVCDEDVGLTVIAQMVAGDIIVSIMVTKNETFEVFARSRLMATLPKCFAASRRLKSMVSTRIQPPCLHW